MSDLNDDERFARERVEDNPIDLALRFELGKCLFALGRFKEAILEFTKAKQNPRCRKEAMQMLARSFDNTRQFQLAREVREQIASEDYGELDPP